MQPSAAELAYSIRHIAAQVSFMLLDMADQLDASPILPPAVHTESPPIPNLAAAVPYRSQWDPDGSDFASDCGPACVAMVLQYFVGFVIDINRLAHEAGMVTGRPFTLPADLIHAAEIHGVVLVRKLSYTVAALSNEIAAGRPVIVLIHYGDLGDFRQDRNYNAGHWVVVVGVDEDTVTIHDPDWKAQYREQGRALAVDRAIFARAWVNCSLDGNTPNQALVVRE